MKDYFMLKRFATDETLHSTMARLRGKYTILALKERRSKNPDQAKIIFLRNRGMEISVKMRRALSDPMEAKEKAIKLYIKELNQLD